MYPARRTAVLGAPWAKNDLWRRARAVPSLDLRFAENKSLVNAVTGQSLVTFTRTSSATYVGSDGLIKTAATDVPRFDHNPTTGESLGLLVEEQRTNFLLQSDSYDSGNASLNNVTVTVNAVTAPDGTLTADSITGSSSVSNTKYAYIGYSTTTIGTYTTSVFLKAGTQSLVLLRINDNGGTNDARQLFNLANGTKSGSAVNGGTATGASSDIVSFGNGWYRCSVTCNFVSALTSIQAASVFFDGYTTSTSTNTFYVWGAQLEAGAFPTSYIPTTTAAVTRSADVASITGTAFSSWYRQDEGTVFTHYAAGSNGARPFFISSTDTQERFEQRILSLYRSSNITLAGVSYTEYADTARQFVAGTAWKHASAQNGTFLAVGSELGVVQLAIPRPPSVNQLWIGSFIGTGTFLNGTIRRLVYWGQRLPNATLQAITQ